MGGVMRALTLLVLAGVVASGCGSKKTVVYQSISTPVQLNVDGPIGEWTPSKSGRLMPTGVWVDVGETTAFSYVDSEKGLSVQWSDGVHVEVRRLSTAPESLVVLSDADVAERGLPVQPDWLQRYGTQPVAGSLYGTWRAVPAFARRSHPDYPDDIRAVIGGPTSDGRDTFEIIWMRVLDCEGLRCEGSLFNEPNDIVNMHDGDRLWVDLVGTQAGRLPVATLMGQEADPKTVRLAASDSRLEGLIQDDSTWVWDSTLEAGERLPPVSQWGFVGKKLAYFFLTYEGVSAALVEQDGVAFQFVQWMPSGFVALTAEQLVEYELPESLEFEGVPSQPEPGLWGQWRANEATSWLFNTSGTPDSAWVKTSLESEDLAMVSVMGCEALVCWGWLTPSGGELQTEGLVEFANIRPPDQTGMVFPIVQPSTR
jgi:hypothetical protein